MKSYHKCKKDGNHNEIELALSRAGCATCDTSGLGDGAPDLMCIRSGIGIMRLFEIKQPGEGYTPKETKWQQRNPRMAQYYRRIETKEAALKEMGLL